MLTKVGLKISFLLKKTRFCRDDTFILVQNLCFDYFSPLCHEPYPVPALLVEKWDRRYLEEEAGVLRDEVATVSAEVREELARLHEREEVIRSIRDEQRQV